MIANNADGFYLGVDDMDMDMDWMDVVVDVVVLTVSLWH